MAQGDATWSTRSSVIIDDDGTDNSPHDLVEPEDAPSTRKALHSPKVSPVACCRTYTGTIYAITRVLPWSPDAP